MIDALQDHINKDSIKSCTSNKNNNNNSNNKRFIYGDPAFSCNNNVTPSNINYNKRYPRYMSHNNQENFNKNCNSSSTYNVEQSQFIANPVIHQNGNMAFNNSTGRLLSTRNFYSGSSFEHRNNSYGQIPNRVFIGGVPPFTTEAELRSIFEQFGYVKDVRLIIDKASNLKGYGFITYDSAEIVKRMLMERDHIVFRGKRLNISSAFRKPKILSQQQRASCDSASDDVASQAEEIKNTTNNNNQSDVYDANVDLSQQKKPDLNTYYPNIYNNCYPYPTAMYYSPQQSFTDYAQYINYFSPQLISHQQQYYTTNNQNLSTNKINENNNMNQVTTIVSPYIQSYTSNLTDGSNILPIDFYKNYFLNSTSPQMYGCWYSSTMMPAQPLNNSNGINCFSVSTSTSINDITQSTILSPNLSFDQNTTPGENNISINNDTTSGKTDAVFHVSEILHDSEQKMKEMNIANQ